MSAPRAYFDWNASAPLRPEARDAMLKAMDEVGNPSSVHAEGRRAKAIVERARAQVADLVGCQPSEVVFTSGATEAAAHLLSDRSVTCPPTEHDCVVGHGDLTDCWSVDAAGRLSADQPVDVLLSGKAEIAAVSAANSETGVLQDGVAFSADVRDEWSHMSVVDAVQAAAKTAWRFDASGADAAILSAHKIGGPRGVGAALCGQRLEREARLVSVGGGQEQGRRAGTENVIGIAGFGAAAAAAKRDLEAGVWDRVENLRNILEYSLEEAAPDLIIFGKDAPRLPNTSCFAVPGWKGETQVMQMDLAGFAVSAGSACSSGKVNKASRVLLAMGFDEVTASSAIRVSLGPTNTEAEVRAFADAWIAAYRRWKAKAA